MHMHIVRKHLVVLGFVINTERSQLPPAQESSSLKRQISCETVAPISLEPPRPVRMDNTTALTYVKCQGG